MAFIAVISLNTLKQNEDKHYIKQVMHDTATILCKLKQVDAYQVKQDEYWLH